MIQRAKEQFLTEYSNLYLFKAASLKSSGRYSQSPDAIPSLQSVSDAKNFHPTFFFCFQNEE